MTNENPREQQFMSENNGAEERLRMMRDMEMGQSPLYDIPGSDLIREVNAVRINREAQEANEKMRPVREVVLDSLAWLEGLEFGPYGQDYDLKNEAVMVNLLNQFTTVESSVQRPQQAYYLKEALNKRLNQSVREARRFLRGGASGRQQIFRDLEIRYGAEEAQRQIQEMTLDAQETVSLSTEFFALSEHIGGRGIIDTAFQQRMLVANLDEKQAGISDTFGGKAAEPDKGTWMAMYQLVPEFGHAVDKVEKLLIDVGYGKVPGLENFFSENITTKKFRRLMEKMLDKSSMYEGGLSRMDVVWCAWKIFLLKEYPAEFGLNTDRNKISFGNPPIVTALHGTIRHPGPTRANELGWTYETYVESTKKGWNGKGETSGEYWALAKSGHPISVGKIAAEDGLCKAYPMETKIGDKTMHQIMYVDGVSQASEEFHWNDLDEETTTGDEPPGGSFGLWSLKRLRSLLVYKDMITPDLSMYVDEQKVTTSWRNWKKLKLVKPGPLVNGEPENPVIWKVAADWAFDSRADLKGLLDYVRYSPKGKLPVNTNNASDKTFVYALRQMQKVNLVSHAEAEWLVKKLKAGYGKDVEVK